MHMYKSHRSSFSVAGLPGKRMTILAKAVNTIVVKMKACKAQERKSTIA